MKTATVFATIVASATAFSPAAQQQSSTALSMAGYQDRFFYPKPTGGMNEKTMGWKMPETVERGPSTHELETSIPPYGTEHQNNAHGGSGPLGFDWTIGKSTALREHSSAAKPTLKPYGEVHQANGKGGKGPLGKEWTTKMDQTYEQGQERFHPFK